MSTSAQSYPLGSFESQSDVGSLQLVGSCEYDQEQQTYTIRGAGTNIWGDHDDFHFVWRRMRGDFIVTMRAAFLGTGKNPHRKLGWMARTSLQTDSPHVCTGIHGDGLLSLQFRRSQGGQTEEVQSALNGADVIQLERQGDTYIMSVAHFGDPFTTVQVSELALGEEVYLGLFVCSHEDDVLETATFRDVRISVPVNTPVGAVFDRSKSPFGSRLEIMDVTNGNREIVYETDDVFEAPNWTRDGKALIYNSGGRLYHFDLATKTPTMIDTGDVVMNNNDHVLSFDGRMLVISSFTEANSSSQIFTVPTTGGQPTQITPAERGHSFAHGWSPDAKYVLFTGMRNGEFDIYRIPAEGGEEVRLTTAPGLSDGSEYTPDGEYIYFNSVRTGSMQIWRMKADGSDQQQLTDDEFNNWFPHVSPDGQSVVFVTYLVGETEPGDHPAAKRVYLRMMPINGGTPKVLAYLYGGQGTMNVPSWSPDSKKIAFVSNTVPFK